MRVKARAFPGFDTPERVSVRSRVRVRVRVSDSYCVALTMQ